MALDYNAIEKELNETQTNSEWVKIKELPTGIYKVKVFGTKWEENKDYFGEQADEATFMFELEDGRAASNSFVFKHNDQEKAVKLLGALKGTARTLGVAPDGSPKEIMERIQSIIEMENGIQATVEIFKIEGLENNRAKFVKPDTAPTQQPQPQQVVEEKPAQESQPQEVDLDAIKF